MKKQKPSRLWQYCFKEEKAGRGSFALVDLAKNSGQVMFDAENGKGVSLYSEFKHTYRMCPQNDPVVRKLDSMFIYVNSKPELKEWSESYTRPLNDLCSKLWYRKMNECEYTFLLNATKEEIIEAIRPDYLGARKKVA